MKRQIAFLMVASSLALAPLAFTTGCAVTSGKESAGRGDMGIPREFTYVFGPWGVHSERHSSYPFRTENHERIAS